MNFRSQVPNLESRISHLKSAVSALQYLRFEISDLKFLWWWLRQVSGDAAYDRYLESTARTGMCVGRQHRTARILTRQEYYLDALERRYSGVSRCC